MVARVLLLSAVLLLAAGHAAADDPEPARNSKKVLEKLQGEWKMESMEVRGKAAPDKLRERYRLTIEKDQWVLKLGDPATSGSTIKIDASKKPMTIDLSGKGKGKGLGGSFRGIIKLEGDVLTFCRVPASQPYPTKFESSDTTTLIVWKRVKK
jgi:uncharacterized protein (TIGR03067 family)